MNETDSIHHSDWEKAKFGCEISGLCRKVIMVTYEYKENIHFKDMLRLFKFLVLF